MRNRLLVLIIAAMLLIGLLCASGCGKDNKSNESNQSVIAQQNQEDNQSEDNNTGEAGKDDNSGESDDEDNSGNEGDASEDGLFTEVHGVLHVDGANLVDKNGKKVQLYGISTHGLAWFPQYVNYDTFAYFNSEWGINCMRLAMYTEEYGGYCSGGDRESLKKLINDGVEAATKLGMYVIIDWHILSEQDPMSHKDEAKSFFAEMSEKYKDYTNVIYEICNEPNGGGTWDRVTAYANEVIPVIRGNDPDALILVGTPCWSQEVDKALAAPLGFDNIMYVLHFYASTHGSWLRDRMQQCINSGLPVFISEFGLCEASGDGAINKTESDEWKKIIEKNNLSFICWNLSNKSETSSLIKSSCNKLSNFTDDELGEEGKYMKDWFTSK